MSKRKSVVRKSGLSLSRWISPALFALAGLAIFPNNVEKADISALFAGNLESGDNWRSFIVPAAAGSIHSEELVFADADITNAIPAGRGIVLPDGRRVALTSMAKPVPSTPDEDRVNRKLKKGRLLAVEKIQPPKDFTAGSILDRQASLLSPELSEEKRTAFVKPAIKGREFEIALAFHQVKDIDRAYGVPEMLASLVTNDTADSLATAYADPEPDYGRQSPFDSILADKKTRRFVPDVDENDHDWADNVLPAIVFTEAEQKCLAQAIYFESATEPLKGQAAVAQVILNRVRNPTFPNTICKVVYQNEDWRNRCQFSFACDRIPDIVWSKSRFKTAKEIAMAVTAGKIYLKEVGDSTHYHATYVRPNWARTMKKMGKIGLHVFYRTYRGGWT